MKKFISLGLLAVLAHFAFSQDKIYLKGGKMEEVTVTEIGPSEIKYTKHNERNEVVFSVLRTDIKRIEFENGDILVVMDDLENPDIYQDQRRHALKVDFLAPLIGSTVVGYERSVRPGLSWETSVNLIGLGKRPEGSRPIGIGGKVGVKFMQTPDFRTGGVVRYGHVMQGLYVRPEIVFAFYTDKYEVNGPQSSPWENRATAGISYGLLSVNVGKQWVFQDVFMIDVYAGLGYGATSIPDDYDQGYYYGYLGSNQPFRLAVTGGFSIGFLLRGGHKIPKSQTDN